MVVGSHGSASPSPRPLRGPGHWFCSTVASKGGDWHYSPGLQRLSSSSFVMPERTVEILNRNGLHARPAAEVVKTAARFQSAITIVRDDVEVNGKSIMGVMMLAAECGAAITIRAEGTDADAALAALEALVAGRFGEH
jgi:phosphocarrier protein